MVSARDPSIIIVVYAIDGTALLLEVDPDPLFLPNTRTWDLTPDAYDSCKVAGGLLLAPPPVPVMYRPGKDS